jgi:antagonist of KipI
MWRSLKVGEGDVIAFSGPRSGLRAYLAVAGGFDVEPVLGSRSTNLASGFGGFEGRLLRKGDILPVAAVNDLTRRVGRAADPGLLPAYASPWRLRVVWGPQDDDFSDAGRRTFGSAVYTVSPDSDRTGIRLKGAVVERRPGVADSIISEAIVPGAIQIPGDGQPIILLGETASGGYRKIATVISADLPLLGQITPGDEVSFEAVSMQAALEALREREDELNAFKCSLA